ncbi:hypothetical protein BV22DRAFT_1052077 [Leucogyrophana mollusca]|uniref:Uncharacterized protein n=1 Tax=Leucogyrophana mollusca TaxID=85980 RepID=A0ACB8AWM6_9AGAM|nr:hypothetical protein BV22DRAFT_1052077 [Leucogyrophana mollusca]
MSLMSPPNTSALTTCLSTMSLQMRTTVHSNLTPGMGNSKISSVKPTNGFSVTAAVTNLHQPNTNTKVQEQDKITTAHEAKVKGKAFIYKDRTSLLQMRPRPATQKYKINKGKGRAKDVNPIELSDSEDAAPICKRKACRVITVVEDMSNDDEEEPLLKKPKLVSKDKNMATPPDAECVGVNSEANGTSNTQKKKKKMGKEDKTIGQAQHEASTLVSVVKGKGNENKADDNPLNFPLIVKFMGSTLKKIPTCLGTTTSKYPSIYLKAVHTGPSLHHTQLVDQLVHVHRATTIIDYSP